MPRPTPTQEQWVQRATAVHGVKRYSYDNTVYMGSQVKVIIHCNVCRDDFEQSPGSHTSGNGCPRCAQATRTGKQIHSTADFVVAARRIHGDKYDYTHVAYNRSNIKVEIVCTQCGEAFQQTPNSHLTGSGCTKCNRASAAVRRRKTSCRDCGIAIGAGGLCKTCSSRRSRAYYQQNRHDINAAQRMRRATDIAWRNEMRARDRARYVVQRERILEYQRKYRNNPMNISRLQRYRRHYYAQNKSMWRTRAAHVMADPERRTRKISMERLRRSTSEYKERARARARARAWRAHHPETTNETLRRKLRARMRCAIRHLNCERAGFTHDLLGCTLEDCRQHIERQFLPGMTWNTYGAWHIDHIVPCAWFDLTDLQQQRKCFHYSNLQPLWARDNITKNNHVVGLYQLFTPHFDL